MNTKDDVEQASPSVDPKARESAKLRSKMLKRAAQISARARTIRGWMGESYKMLIPDLRAKWQEFGRVECPELIAAIAQIIAPHNQFCEEISAPVRGDQRWQDFAPNAEMSERKWRIFVKVGTPGHPADGALDRTGIRTESSQKPKSSLSLCQKCGLPLGSAHVQSECPNSMDPQDIRKIDWNLGFDLRKKGAPANDVRLRNRYVLMGYEAHQRMGFKPEESNDSEEPRPYYAN